MTGRTVERLALKRFVDKLSKRQRSAIQSLALRSLPRQCEQRETV
jgi:hypothetical protein